MESERQKISLRDESKAWIRGGLWVGVGGIAANLAFLAASIVLGRVLQREGYGSYQFFQGLILIMAVVGLPGFYNALIQALARGRNGALRQLIPARIWAGSVGAILLFALAGFYKGQQNPPLGPSLVVLAGIIFFITNPASLWQPALTGKEWFVSFGVLRFIQALVHSVFVISTAVITRSTTATIIAAALAFVITECGAFIWVYFKIPKKPKDKEVVRYGFKLCLPHAIPLVAQYLDRIIIGTLLGAGPLGLYAVAATLPEGIRGFLGLLQGLAVSRLSRLTEPQAWSRVKTVWPILTIISVGAGGLCWTAAPFFIKLLYGPTYGDASDYARWLFISISVYPAFYLITAAQQATKKTKGFLILTSFESVLEIIFMSIGAVAKGIPGLVAGKVLARILSLGAAVAWVVRDEAQKRT